MPFEVRTPYAKWPAGAVVTGGELSAHVGSQIPANEKPTKAQQKKLGLTDSKGITEARIKELCRRGILHGIGSDTQVFTLEDPNLGLPKFEDRQKAVIEYNQSLLTGSERM